MMDSDSSSISHKRCIGPCGRMLPITAEFFYQYKKGGYWHPRCKECAKLVSKHHRETHREEYKQYDRQNYQSRREERLAQYRERYQRNREAVLEQRKQDRQERPEVYRVRGRFKIQRRRALKRNIIGALTVQQVQAKLKSQKYACYYCFTKFEQRVDKTYIYHLDHTIPVSRAEYSPRHDMNFIVLACPHCNQCKSDKLPHEWPEGGRLL